MQFQDIYKMTQYAFEHNEVSELLMGKKNYEYQAPMYPVSLPTCIEFVLRDGIYPLYKNVDNKKTVIQSYCDALMQMIQSNDPITVWWATSILFSQKNREEKDKSPFEVADKFWAELKKELIQYKEKLSHLQIYQGAGCSQGLWSDVLRINRLLLKKYDIQIMVGSLDG